MDAMFHGRKMYEELIKMQQGSGEKKSNPFAHMKHYVFSKTLNSVQEGFTLVKGDLEKEVIKIKSEPGKNIVLFGGASLLSTLLSFKLIDELVLAICPLILGKGKPFFTGIENKINFTLKESKTFDSGLVNLTYILNEK